MQNLNFERGSHICHLYRGAGELKEVTLAFVREGLERGDCCLYVANGDAVDDWYIEFQAYGIDVVRAREAGALNVITSAAWRRLSAHGSIVMAREFFAVIDRRLSEFGGFRIAGDTGWASEPAAVPSDQVCHWEATANFVFHELDVRAICQYDLDNYAPEFVHSALRTHPVVLYQGRKLENPFYEAPVILKQEPHLNHSSNDPRVVEGMLETLASLAQ